MCFNRLYYLVQVLRILCQWHLNQPRTKGGLFTCCGPGAINASFDPIRIIHNTTTPTDGRICLSNTGNNHSVLYPPNPLFTTSTLRRYVFCNPGPKDGELGSKDLCNKLTPVNTSLHGTTYPPAI